MEEYLNVEARGVLQAGGSVWLFHGADDAGRAITFGVDWRQGIELADLIHAEGPIPCAVEPWQVLS